MTAKTPHWPEPSPDEKGGELSMGLVSPPHKNTLLTIETLITKFMEHTCLEERSSRGQRTKPRTEDCDQWPMSQEGRRP